MELDFDKEIDALLRQMPKSDADFAGKDALNLHLDADEISAFAENALPEKAKQRYAAHLADCDSCRKNLSELILLNAENEPETVSEKEEVLAAAPVVIPWYRKLFAFPNLAYTMGAFVLAFTGLTAFIVLQNFTGTSSEVAQVEDDSRKSANKLFEGNSMSANSNASIPENSSESNTNAALNVANVVPQGSPEILDDSPIQDKSADQKQSITEPKATVSPNDENDLLLARSNDKEIQTDGITTNKPQPEILSQPDASEESSVASKSMATPQPAAAAPPPKTATKRKEVLAGRSDEVKDDAVEREKKLESQGFSSSRKISGKTFNRKNGVWYDSAYRNQPTTNVRRGTNEYQNLDSGLRSIAENLSGTIVVLWKEKAYRIQ